MREQNENIYLNYIINFKANMSLFHIVNRWQWRAQTRDHQRRRARSMAGSHSQWRVSLTLIYLSVFYGNATRFAFVLSIFYNITSVFA